MGRPRLILITDMDWDSDTDSDTMDMDFMVSDTDTDLELDTSDMPDTLDTSTARGLLMLSLRPRLILTTDTVSDTDTDLDTSDMPDSDTAESTTANRLHHDLSVNHRLNLGQKWIIISLKFPSPVLQFQCYHN